MHSHFVRIRSRNFSAKQLYHKIQCKIPTVLRLGSVTPNENIFNDNICASGNIREINTVDACIVSGDKILMKKKFDTFEVPTARWDILSNCIETENSKELNFPVIVKHKHSSKGNGLYFIETFEQLCETEFPFSTNSYIVEEYKTFSKEYRIHCSTNGGVFLAHRKMLKNDAEIRWHRHHNNSVWICEDNPLFDKPENWNDICDAAVLALTSVGLDIGCVDVKVQTSNKINPKFIILETNSAPAMGEDTANKYIEHINQYYND